MYTCSYCKYITKNRNEIIDHLISLIPCCSTNNKDYAFFFDESIYICKFCTTMLDTVNSINQHLRKSCKMKKDKNILIEYNNIKTEINNIETDLEKRKKELEKIETTINNTGKQIVPINFADSNNNSVQINNDSNVLNQTIFIVECGKEDPKKLTIKDEQEIFKSCNNSIIKCTEKMNFNPNIPEHYNMFVSNIRGDYAYKYMNGKFNAVMLESFIEEIIRSRAENVRDILERIDNFTLPDNTKIRTKDKILKLLENIDNDDEKTMFLTLNELSITEQSIPNQEIVEFNRSVW